MLTWDINELSQVWLSFAPLVDTFMWAAAQSFSGYVEQQICSVACKTNAKGLKTTFVIKST